MGRRSATSTSGRAASGKRWPRRSRRRSLRRIEDDRQDPLHLERDEMRALGYRTVDALVDWLSRGRPPLEGATPSELHGRLRGPAPEDPEPFDAVLGTLLEDVLPFTSNGAHPAFFAYVPFAGTWPGALGDFVASAANVYSGSWQEGAGPTQLELEIIDWFKTWVGFPETATGTLLTGGSAAHPHATAGARGAAGGAERGGP